MQTSDRGVTIDIMAVWFGMAEWSDAVASGDRAAMQRLFAGWLSQHRANRKDISRRATGVLEQVATWVATPPAVLAQLADIHDDGVAWCVASNPNTRAATLRLLYESSCDREVLAALAEHAACPVDILEHLALHLDWSIRLAVAENTITPQRILARLAVDPWERVRLGAAANPNLPANIKAMTKLAMD